MFQLPIPELHGTPGQGPGDCWAKAKSSDFRGNLPRCNGKLYMRDTPFSYYIFHNTITREL